MSSWGRLMVLLAACLVLACSASAKPRTDRNGAAGSGGTGGGAGSGALDVDAATGTAGHTNVNVPDAGGDENDAARPHVDPPRSRRQACLALRDAQLQRSDACVRRPTQQRDVFAKETCPDQVFAPGASYTIDSAFACAEAWKTFPCSALAEGKRPSCVLDGTRGSGETCQFDAQCASQVCLGTRPMEPSCRYCLTRVADGASCDPNGTTVCAAASACTSGKCSAPAPIVAVNAGDACERDEQCPDALSCFEQAGVAKCAQGPGEGAACGRLGKLHTCAAGFRCSVDLKCHAPAKPGMPCVQDPDAADLSSDPPECARGAYCDASGTCRALPSAGSPCAMRPDLDYHVCDAAARCDATTCVPRDRVGDACMIDGQLDNPGSCTPAAVCACTNPNDCSSGATCQTLLFEGESCGMSNARCELGTECAAGTCVAVESMGIAEGVDQSCPAQ